MLPLFGADASSGSWLSMLQGLARLWPLWLPLVVGGLAIFWLLPRPRAYPWVWGALAGILALVLGGVYLVHAKALTAETVLFYAFSGIALASGALLVTQHNPARAALSFALVVLSTCGLFLLLAAPFLMAATIIVYAGAIIVTFLFVLMLAQQEGLSDADDRSREPLLSTITGFVLLGALLYVLEIGSTVDGRARVEMDKLLDEVRAAMKEENPDMLALFAQSTELLKAHGWLDLRNQTDNISDQDVRDQLRKLEAILLEGRERLGTVRLPADRPMSAMSGPRANIPASEVRRDAKTHLPALPAENSAYLGRSLFTDYLLPVELAGTLLLVATIGAIAIGQRRAAQERRDRVPIPSPGGLPSRGNV
jgi:NADH:ubiquinone oxidoreductase subunit 6 (subunit J)